MNDQLPPIDSDLREQLTRRSAGRLPEGLLDGVLTALNSAPRPAGIARLPRVAWRVPRLATAGLGTALVAILAVAIALPALRGGPASPLAGYPADRALTTAELAELLAGPPLAINTPLVVSATIDIRSDVCPMNRYPTAGVIDGMDPQVCVMQGSLPPELTGTTVTGTFAFRYLGRGYLGLLGEITPASASKLAFHVADDWPLAGKTFLVDGWLGAYQHSCPAGAEASAGDVLNPDGDDPCETDWLTDDPNAQPSADATAGILPPGGGEFVEAGGMRIIDEVPGSAPSHGVFVVRSVTEGCTGDPPTSSRGCSAWRVLAKVADVSLPQPTAPPTAAATPLAGYPAGRALTTAELATLMAGPPLPTNTALVASVTIDAKTDVCPMNRYPTIGVVAGMDPQVCVMGAGVSAYLKEAAATGVFAFRYLAPGVLGLLGEIAPAAGSKVAFHVADDWPLGGETFLVQGWLGADELTVQCASTPAAGDVLAPDGEDCPYDDWLGDSSDAPRIQADHEYNFGSPEPSYDPLSLRGNARHVEAGGMRLIDSIDPAAPVFGVYVVRADTSGCPNPSAANSGCATWRVLARVTDVPRTPPSATPSPTPTAAPPETPVALPTGSAGPAPIGLMGSGNRPLTEAEFATLWAADPAHLAGRIAIAKGPVPTGFECWSAGAAHAAVPSPACHLAILDGFIAQEGYWAVRVGADGKLAIVGQVATTQGSFVFSLEQAVAAWDGTAWGDLLIVDASLQGTNDCGWCAEPVRHHPLDFSAQLRERRATSPAG